MRKLLRLGLKGKLKRVLDPKFVLEGEGYKKGVGTLRKKWDEDDESTRLKNAAWLSFPLGKK